MLVARRLRSDASSRSRNSRSLAPRLLSIRSCKFAESAKPARSAFSSKGKWVASNSSSTRKPQSLEDLEWRQAGCRHHSPGKGSLTIAPQRLRQPRHRPRQHRVRAPSARVVRGTTEPPPESLNFTLMHATKDFRTLIGSPGLSVPSEQR